MPKYILIGLAVIIILFFTMHFWSKMSEKTKNQLANLTLSIGIPTQKMEIILNQFKTQKEFQFLGDR